MKKNIYLLSLLCLILVSNSITASSIGEKQQLPIVIENGGSGAYKAIALGDEGLPGMTIYRPEDLSVFKNEEKLPIILWGNGGCFNSSVRFKNFLNEIASNGFIVLAIGPFEELSVAIEDRDKTSTDSSLLLNALDWIIDQNNNKTSIYNNVIDINKVAAMGQSCGGLQAIEISTDPRITTSVICNSGVLNEVPEGYNLPKVNKEILGQLQIPLMYVIGGPSDIAYPNATDDYARITDLPVVILNQDVGHDGTYENPYGGSFSIPTIAWLNWHLKNDQEASFMFIGDECQLCDDDSWTFEKKNID